MRVCNDCLKGSCGGPHLSNFFGPCEDCLETKELWDCTHDMEGKARSKTLDQVRQDMAEYLYALACQLRREKDTAASISILECAGMMCKIAGIPEAVVAETLQLSREP